MKKTVFLLFLGILVLPGLACAVPGYMKARMGTMSGQVFVGGEPAKSVVLIFFSANKGLPATSEGGMNRVPEMLTRADEKGRFQQKLMAGSYYLKILFRPYADRPGPPRKGEKFYFANDGQGKLRQLAISDFKQVDVGRIDCSTPSVFTEIEEHFTVEGVVVQGEGADVPLADVMVLAKGSAAARRPDYFSGATDRDGKFSLKLPPGRTFYLVARASITGNKPNPGEDIGKLGVDQDPGKVPEFDFSGTPVPPSEDFLSKTGTRGQVNDTGVPVTGKVGEVVSGLKIHMFKMPDGQALREARQNAAGLGRQGGGQNGIEFDQNSDLLGPVAKAGLDGWAKLLLGKKEVRVEISGYELAAETVQASKVGPGEMGGKSLAERRSGAVKEYLQEKGVEAERMRVIGNGGKEKKNGGPIGTMPAAKGRVEISVLDMN